MILRPRIWLVVVIAIGLWVAGGLWLDRAIGWPRHYGFHCTYRDCLIADVSHSIALLHDGPYAWLKFIHIWLPLVALVIFALWLKVGRSAGNDAPSSHSSPE
jgi:hypothetical protein